MNEKQKHPLNTVQHIDNIHLNYENSARFGSTYTKIETIQRRLAWPLRKDDTQIREAFHIFLGAGPLSLGLPK